MRTQMGANADANGMSDCAGQCHPEPGSRVAKQRLRAALAYCGKVRVISSWLGLVDPAAPAEIDTPRPTVLAIVSVGTSDCQEEGKLGSTRSWKNTLPAESVNISCALVPLVVGVRTTATSLDAENIVSLEVATGIQLPSQVESDLRV